jgi:hypothetical protein
VGPRSAPAPADECSQLRPTLETKLTHEEPLDDVNNCPSLYGPNGDGAFVYPREIHGELPASTRTTGTVLRFVTLDGGVGSDVPLDGLAFFSQAQTTGFVTFRSTFDGGRPISWIEWYTSVGQPVSEFPFPVAGPVERQNGTEEALVQVSRLDDLTPHPPFQVQRLDLLGHPVGTPIELPGSIDVRGPVMLAYDGEGNILVAGRKIARERFPDDTPEVWYAWWVGTDGAVTERFDLFGSRLQDAGVWLEGFVPLNDGTLAIDVYDTAMYEHRWFATLSRISGLQGPPCWLAERPNTTIRSIRGRRGYFVRTAYSTEGVDNEILTSTGATCGTLQDLCAGCELIWAASVGLDGTLINPSDRAWTESRCAFDWWPHAFR